MAGPAGAGGRAAGRIHDEFHLDRLSEFQATRPGTNISPPSCRCRFSDPGGPQPIEETALTGPTASVLTHAPAVAIRADRARSAAFELSALRAGGRDLVLQFFFYSMGETKMGRYTFSSWTLHMASIVIFSTLWGVGLKEWRGAGKRRFVCW